jgi:chromosomal replication initiator protein
MSLELWDRIKDYLKNELSERSYDIWIKPLKLGIFHEEEGELEIYVPSEFYRQWLLCHYLTKIKNFATELAKREINVKFTLSKIKIPQIISQDSLSCSSSNLIVRGVKFNPKYTFNNFVVGPCNRLAYAASFAVASTPAQTYNPLFIYGGVGLGKTHLLQAIGQHVVINSPNTRVVYSSLEQFMNAYIKSLQRGRRYQFQEHYRQVDLLLVDDVDYLAGKEGTQEEFFHTFIGIYEREGKIVLSSDRLPKDIPNLKKRLCSRFESGLLAELRPPDFETRIAILRKKVEERNLSIPQEGVLLIAEKIKGNIRELESIIYRVAAYSALEEEKINLAFIERILKDISAYNADNKKKEVTDVEIIKKRVADYFKLKVSELCGKGRKSEIVLPRQIAMYLARELTNLSFLEIGKNFGSRDHSTVIYGHRKIKEAIIKDENLKRIIDELVFQLKRSDE